MSSIKELENDLENARQELEINVEALSDYVNPGKTVNRLKATTLDKVARISDRATKLVQQAQAGDSEALKVLAGVTGISILGVLLLLRKLFK